MKVNIIHEGKPVTNKDVIESLEYYVHSYLAFWGVTDSRLKINIILECDFIKNLSPEAAAATYKISNKNYIISVQKGFKGQVEELLQILAHEITHVKQHYLGELKYKHITKNKEIIGTKTLWMGEDVSHLDYEDCPHEEEAWHYQFEMANLLIEEITLMISNTNN